MELKKPIEIVTGDRIRHIAGSREFEVISVLQTPRQMFVLTVRNERDAIEVFEVDRDAMYEVIAPPGIESLEDEMSTVELPRVDSEAHEHEVPDFLREK